MTNLEKLNDINYLKTITSLDDEQREYLCRNFPAMTYYSKELTIEHKCNLSQLEEHLKSFKEIYGKNCLLRHTWYNFVTMQLIFDVPCSDKDIIHKYIQYLVNKKRNELKNIYLKKIDKMDVHELEIMVEKENGNEY